MKSFLSLKVEGKMEQETGQERWNSLSVKAYIYLRSQWNEKGNSEHLTTFLDESY